MYLLRMTETRTFLIQFNGTSRHFRWLKSFLWTESTFPKVNTELGLPFILKQSSCLCTQISLYLSFQYQRMNLGHQNEKNSGALLIVYTIFNYQHLVMKIGDKLWRVSHSTKLGQRCRLSRTKFAAPRQTCGSRSHIIGTDRLCLWQVTQHLEPAVSLMRDSQLAIWKR